MIICYMGGSCGDLLTAIVDPKDAVIDANDRVLLSSGRQKLKKPHEFKSTVEKDQYLKTITKSYNSIPSHDIEYHIKKKHDFVGIIVEKIDTALWAAERFKQIHSTEIWEGMQIATGGTKTIKEYAQMMLDYRHLVLQNTQKTVTLESILEGTVIEQLQPFVTTLPGIDFYQSWLKAQKKL